MTEKEKETKKANEEETTHEVIFMQFVSGLYTSTMQHLGKLMNPVTAKVEKNLDAAKATIELVRMLKKKTEGNLNENESRMVNNALSNMQMNYVDELEKESKDSKAGDEKEKCGKSSGTDQEDTAKTDGQKDKPSGEKKE